MESVLTTFQVKWSILADGLPIQLNPPQKPGSDPLTGELIIKTPPLKSWICWSRLHYLQNLKIFRARKKRLHYLQNLKKIALKKVTLFTKFAAKIYLFL